MMVATDACTSNEFIYVVSPYENKKTDFHNLFCSSEGLIKCQIPIDSKDNILDKADDLNRVMKFQISINSKEIESVFDNTKIRNNEKLLEVAEFEANFFNAQKEAKRLGYRYIYTFFRENIEQYNFELCDNILKSIDVSKYNTTELICFLSASLKYKEKLFSRQNLYIYVKEKFFQQYEIDYAMQLIAGL